MRIEELHVSMRVRHPQYGAGTVFAINEHTAIIKFEDNPVRQTVAPDVLMMDEAQVAITGMTQSLPSLVKLLIAEAIEQADKARSREFTDGMLAKWRNGKVIFQPADATLAVKELPIEQWFHKVVLVRNRLRVMEQKINASEKLTDDEKVELQFHITGCYGTLTSFNAFFKNKEDQFVSGH